MNESQPGRAVAMLVAVVCMAACSHRRTIVLDEVERLEVYESKGKAEPDVVLEGEELDEIFSAARCHDGSVLWKGGYPATFVMADGRRRRSRGLSFYGRFVVLPDGRWCEFDEENWRALHEPTGE